MATPASPAGVRVKELEAENAALKAEVHATPVTFLTRTLLLRLPHGSVHRTLFFIGHTTPGCGDVKEACVATQHVLRCVVVAN